jgi:hypothetical protein
VFSFREQAAHLSDGGWWSRGDGRWVLAELRCCHGRPAYTTGKNESTFSILTNTPWRCRPLVKHMPSLLIG